VRSMSHTLHPLAGLLVARDEMLQLRCSIQLWFSATLQHSAVKKNTLRYSDVV